MFSLLRPYNKYQLTFHSQECVFVGYSVSHKGYKCISPSDHIYVSKDVIFNEHKFPYSDLFQSKQTSTNTERPSLSVIPVLTCLLLFPHQFPAIILKPHSIVLVLILDQLLSLLHHLNQQTLTLCRLMLSLV